jgi:mannose-6-phosphate isomerase-like protein (cupin superfamily)
MEKAMDAMGSKHKATTEERNKHATMHMTDSVDYLVVLAGELTMIMDVGEVTLKPGDCIVQRGTRHGWANRGDMPVLLAAVLIDAQHIAGH